MHHVGFTILISHSVANLNIQDAAINASLGAQGLKTTDVRLSKIQNEGPHTFSQRYATSMRMQNFKFSRNRILSLLCLWM
jgi:hypothetical protein